MLARGGRPPTWVGLSGCLEAGNQVNRLFRIDPVLGNSGSEVDSVWQITMVCYHHITQALALQTAAPPRGNEWVYLRS